MNIEKIQINGHYVWVDKGAEIKDGDWATDGGSAFKNVAINPCQEIFGVRKKIIAASPELNLEGVPTYVEWLAEQEYPNEKGGSMWMPSSFDLDQSKRQSGFIKGYQTAEKELPTWDDVRKAIEMAGMTFTDKDYSYQWTTEEIIEQLKKDKQ